MFRIEGKDYDLNFLMRFDMLKEILMNLLKNQNNLQYEIDLLKNSNKERDKKIINIEEIITGMQEESSRDGVEIEQKNEEESPENKESKEIKEKQIEEKEINYIINNVDNKIENNKETKNDINDNTGNIKQLENKALQEEDKIQINKESNNEINKEEKKEKEIIENKEVIIKKEEPEKILSDKTSNKSNVELLEKGQSILTPEKKK